MHNSFICITSYGGYIGRLGWVNQGRYSIISPAGRGPSHGWWRLRPASQKWIGDDVGYSRAFVTQAALISCRIGLHLT